jgi:hypothetical protein
VNLKPFRFGPVDWHLRRSSEPLIPRQATARREAALSGRHIRRISEWGNVPGATTQLQASRSHRHEQASRRCRSIFFVCKQPRSLTECAMLGQDCPE